MPASRSLYVALARTLGEADAPASLVDAIAVDLRVDNPRFNVTTFFDAVDAARPVSKGFCENCERCTWNPGPDCGLTEHPHCPTCGHCEGRHAR